MTTKQALDNWAAYVKAITDATAIDVEEDAPARALRIGRLESDPEAWFSYYFPRYTFATPAGFHKEATKRVIENKEWYEVRMWSRELAKSTRTMMEVFYLVLVGNVANTIPSADEQARSRKKYCLLVSNSFENAVRLLAPYKLNLESNQRIIQDYGQQAANGKWQAGDFTTETGICFRALGAGQSPRGTRSEEARPDILLFDDVDTDMDCQNSDIIGKKWRWIEEAAIGTRSVSQPATIIFCGNRIAVDCCVVRAVPFADHADIRNIRDENGQSTWPEKNTEAHIDRVLKQKSYAAAQKEYFNNPITEGAVFRDMSFKPAYPVNKYHGLVCYSDPSYTATGDNKATVLVGRLGDEFHVLKAFVAQTTTAAMLDWHRQIMQYTGSDVRCRYFIEDVFMQDVVIKELSESARKTGVPINLQRDKRKKPGKFLRIEALLEPLNRTGKLFLNQAEQQNPHMVRLAEQFKAFSPNSSAHDDGPDAVEGAIWLLNDEATQAAANIQPLGQGIRMNRF